MLYLKALILLILIAIALQDYKFRAVYWWLFPLLLIAMGTLKSISLNFKTMAWDFGANLIFLTVQLFFLTLYFIIKERKLVNIFKSLFGLGDLLFLVSIAAYFSVIHFLAFYIMSLFFVLVLRLIKDYLKIDRHPQIPLAGEQSILLAFLLVVAQFMPSADNWMINSLVY